MHDVDRAVIDGEEEGFVKIHVREGTDRILGATVVARHAGEMINAVSLAIRSGMGLHALADVNHPFPTQAQGIKMAGDAYRRTRLTRFGSIWRDAGWHGPGDDDTRIGFFPKFPQIHDQYLTRRLTAPSTAKEN